MGQLLLFFLRNFSSIFSYVGGVLVSKLQTFFHYYWLTYFGYSANYNIEEHFCQSFWSVAKLWTASEALAQIEV